MTIKLIRRIIFILAFLFFVPKYAFAQTQTNIELLKKEINSNIHDTIKVNKLIDLAKEYYDINVDSGIVFAKHSLDLATKINSQVGIGNAYYNLAELHQSKSDYANALDYALKALNIRKSIGIQRPISSVLNMIGTIYDDQELFTEALNYYNQSLKIVEQINLNKGIVTIANNIGSIYYGRAKYDSSLYDSAIIYYQKAIKLADNDPEITGLYMYLSNLGGAYVKQNRLTEARGILAKALSLTLSHKNNESLSVKEIESQTYFYIAELEFKSKNVKAALAWGMQGFELASKIRNQYNIKRASEILYRIYESTGNFNKALFYYKHFKMANDSIFDISKTKALNSLQKNLELSQSKKEKVNIEIQLKSQKILNLFLLIFAVLILTILMINFRFLNKKAKLNTELNAKNAVIENANEELKKQNKLIIESGIELKQLNEDLVSREIELSETNAAKDKFLSIIAHDIKNPLHAALMSSDLLVNFRNKMTESEIAKHILGINQTTKNLATLLDNLLQWAMAQMGKIRNEPKVSDLKSHLDSIIELFREVAGKKNIRIINEVKSGIDILVDLNMSGAILRNLISNSIKFTNTGGCVKISSELDGGFVMIIVEDNGVGISPENLNKLFRLDSAITTPGTNKEAGSGLGLLLVKEYVQNHGGRIWAESELGRGSKFKFTLPINN